MLQNLCFLAEENIMGNVFSTIAATVFLVPCAAVLIFMNSASIAYGRKQGIRGILCIIFFMLFSLGFLAAVIGLIFRLNKIAIAGGITAGVSIILIIIFNPGLKNKKYDEDYNSSTKDLANDNLTSEQEMKEVEETIAENAKKTVKFVLNWESNKWKILVIGIIVGFVAVGCIYAFKVYKALGPSGLKTSLLTLYMFVSSVFTPVLVVGVPVCLFLIIRRIVINIRNTKDDSDLN